jgi:hypothetical protein
MNPSPIPCPVESLDLLPRASREWSSAEQRERLQRMTRLAGMARSPGNPPPRGGAARAADRSDPRAIPSNLIEQRQRLERLVEVFGDRCPPANRRALELATPPPQVRTGKSGKTTGTGRSLQAAPKAPALELAAA